MSATAERIFRTRTQDHGLPVLSVENIKCAIKKISTTNEGGIAIAIELTATDDTVLEQIQDLIRIQQGECLMSVSGVQGELPL